MLKSFSQEHCRETVFLSVLWVFPFRGKIWCSLNNFFYIYTISVCYKETIGEGIKGLEIYSTKKSGFILNSGEHW